jgi:hypothetical protein
MVSPKLTAAGRNKEVVVKSIHIMLLSLLVVILSGCVSSENGLCSADERGAFFDPAIQGEWALFSCQNGPVKDKEIRRFKVARHRPESKAYRVTEDTLSIALEGVEYVDKAYLIRLGDAVFLDYYREMRSSQSHSEFHEILKVDRRGEHELRLLPLSPEFIKRHPGTIRHSVKKGFPFETVELVAPSKELIDFVKQNARNHEAWIDPGFLLRRL